VPVIEGRTIRVVLADDHDVVRRGLAMVLEASGKFTVVGEARTGYEAVECAGRLRPDLLLLDVRMPGIDGIQAARLVKQEAPDVRILILTGITASPMMLTLFKGAADGYVLKDATPNELLDAAERVARGVPYLQASLIRRLLGVLPVETVSQQAAALTSPLTPRELDVLRLMATSHTNREIASQLHVGEETVRSHVKHILGKLCQPDRTQAVIAAVRAGLLDMG
jgi:DNA-binding NarL/FixJ family response regulator